jgi:hypothetical protein
VPPASWPNRSLRCSTPVSLPDQVGPGLASYMLLCMRHQEHMLVVGMQYYWLTLIYRPSGYAIGGTTQLALLSSSTFAIISWRRPYQCQLRTWLGSRSYPASSRQDNYHDATSDLLGAGRRVSPMHGTRS